MDFLQEWGDLLLPKEGFKPVDLWQVLIVIIIFAISSKFLSGKYAKIEAEKFNPLGWLKRNVGFIAFWLTLALFYAGTSLSGTEAPVFRFFTYLGGAWFLIGLLSSLLRERFWAQSVASVCYLITGLFGLDLVEDGIKFLNGLQLRLGTIEVSAWSILAGMMAFALTLWISLAIARILETRIQSVPRLSPSLKVLITKIIRILFIIIASVVAFSSMGVDLSALTVLGGAVGIGLGFGLQKVVSNFVSGIILLMDNSIKPGDVIEIEDTYGWINNLRARYASVITRDGTEHLIPNEDLITQRVINWSFTDNLVRVKVPIGVSYGADPHRCIQLVLDAAHSVSRVLKDPAPTCPLRGFGDSSVDLELRFWIGDPANGIANVQSEVLLKVWDTFKENDIEIPFPQRDLHIRSSEILHVQRNHPDPD